MSYNPSNSVQSQGGVNSSFSLGSSDVPGGDTNVLLWAFSMLIDSISTQLQSSVVKAKGLAANGAQQEKVNNSLCNVSNAPVPSLKYHETKITHKHYHMFQHFTWTTYTYTYNKRLLNGTAVQLAQMKAEQENAIRQNLQNQAAVLQQNAQGQAAMVDSLGQSTLQSTQGASYYLQTLQTISQQINRILF